MTEAFWIGRADSRYFRQVQTHHCLKSQASATLEVWNPLSEPRMLTFKGRLCHQLPIRGLQNNGSAGPICHPILREKSSARSSRMPSYPPPPKQGCSPLAWRAILYPLPTSLLPPCFPLLSLPGAPNLNLTCPLSVSLS